MRLLLVDHQPRANAGERKHVTLNVQWTGEMTVAYTKPVSGDSSVRGTNSRLPGTIS